MKAIVLCAGYGTRLGGLTREVPKAMLPIEGRPLLEYVLSNLAAWGFDDLAVNLHFQPEQIRTHFGNGAKWNVRIHYVFEPQLLGTAGAVKNFEPWIGDAQDILVVYGDILTDQSLSLLWKAHQANGGLATLLLHERAGSNSLVQLDAKNRITAFLERPDEETRRKCPFPWVNSGIQALNRQILDYIPANQPADLPRDVYAKILHHEKIFGLPLTGFRCAIDSPARYEQAIEAVRSGQCRPGWLP